MHQEIAARRMEVEFARRKLLIGKVREAASMLDASSIDLAEIWLAEFARLFRAVADRIEARGLSPDDLETLHRIFEQSSAIILRAATRLETEAVRLEP